MTKQEWFQILQHHQLCHALVILVYSPSPIECFNVCVNIKCEVLVMNLKWIVSFKNKNKPGLVGSDKHLYSNQIHCHPEVHLESNWATALYWDGTRSLNRIDLCCTGQYRPDHHHLASDELIEHRLYRLQDENLLSKYKFTYWIRYLYLSVY